MNPPPPDREAFINDFCNRLQQLLENSPLAGFRATCEDSRENIRAVGEALLGQMNVVSRADFDEQNAILAKTTERLAQLEEKITQLEAQLEKNAAAKK